MVTQKGTPTSEKAGITDFITQMEGLGLGTGRDNLAFRRMCEYKLSGKNIVQFLSNVLLFSLKSASSYHFFRIRQSWAHQ